MSDIRFNRWLHQSGTGGVYQDSTGNIGIGTSVPTSALDVQSGTIKIGSNTLSSTGVSTFTTVNATRIVGVSTAGINTAYISTLSGISTIDASASIGINQNLVFASGKGIDFSATANSSGTMTSELLDDYEEGTWTPTILASTSTVSYSTQYGVYTKVGRIVYCSIAIRASSVTGGNTVGLSGLPYTADNTSDTTQRSTWRLSNGGHVVGLSDATGRFRVNGSTMDGVKGDTTTTYMSCAQLTSSGSIEITGDFWYFTAS